MMNESAWASYAEWPFGFPFMKTVYILCQFCYKACYLFLGDFWKSLSYSRAIN